MVQPDKQESKQKWQKGFMDEQEEQGSLILTEGGVGQRIFKQILHAQILGLKYLKESPYRRRILCSEQLFHLFVTREFRFFLLKRKIY